MKNRVLLAAILFVLASPLGNASQANTLKPAFGLPDQFRVFRGELVPVFAVSLSGAEVAALGDGIQNILRTRSEKQMLRIHARRVVARVADILITAKRDAVHELPKHARSNTHPSVVVSNSATIVFIVAAFQPRPTGVRASRLIAPRQHQVDGDRSSSRFSPSSKRRGPSLVSRPRLGRASTGGPSKFPERNSMRVFHTEDSALSLAHYQGGNRG